jgi:hypothetical protein
MSSNPLHLVEDRLLTPAHMYTVQYCIMYILPLRNNSELDDTPSIAGEWLPMCAKLAAKAMVFLRTAQDLNVDSFSLRNAPYEDSARICKRLWSPGIDSGESIPPAYVAWRAGATNRIIVPDRQAGNRFLGSLKD